ncbi:PE domain-containing protein [Mycobacterium sp.]
MTRQQRSGLIQLAAAAADEVSVAVAALFGEFG